MSTKPDAPAGLGVVEQNAIKALSHIANKNAALPCFCPLEVALIPAQFGLRRVLLRSRSHDTLNSRRI
ncbi:MAG: hypothetical protein AAFY34_01950 [Pseudomonadota bacterium]